jgi:hypothetical protein
MEVLGKTPFEFGLKVRQSETGIAITAANKMRSSQPVSLAENFSERHIQAHTIFDNNDINKSNFNAVKTMVSSLGKCTTWSNKALLWRNDASFVEKLLKEIELPQNEFMRIGSNGESLVDAYIQDRSRSELKEWDIAIPFISKTSEGKSSSFPFAYLSDSQGEKYCRSRNSGIRENKDLVKITSKNAVAFGTDDLSYGENETELKNRVEKARLDFKDQNPSTNWLYASSRTRPLLVIHILNFDLQEDDQKNKLKITDECPTVTISMVFPTTYIPCEERNYRASARLIQMMQDQRKELEIDEEVDDE